MSKDYESKMAARFDTFDQNADGVITESDFRAMAERVLSAVGESADSSKRQNLLAGAKRFFDGLASHTDLDKDGRITKSEFLLGADISLYSNAEGFAEVARPWVVAVIEAADRDDDGWVSYEEWSRVQQAMGAEATAARAQAERLDANGDGAITVDEILRGAVEFYTSDEPRHEYGAL